jgi:hypothetical protein
MVNILFSHFKHIPFQQVRKFAIGVEEFVGLPISFINQHFAKALIRLHADSNNSQFFSSPFLTPNAQN